MNNQAQRAEIKRYVDKAFTAKIMRMNDVRLEKRDELYRRLAAHGHSRSSSAYKLGEVDIEEECIADLLKQKGDLYLEAYERKDLRIGPEVMQDIANSYSQVVGGRKSALTGEAQLTALRTNKIPNQQVHARLGVKSTVVMKEIEAQIDLYNLSHREVPTQVMPVSPLPSVPPARQPSIQENELRLEHLREDYKLARHGLYGGLISTVVVVAGIVIVAATKMQSLGGYFVLIVLIVAAAVIIYFAFVFGRLATIKAKISRTQLDLNMQAGGEARKI